MKYRMEDGTVINTKSATRVYDEKRESDGRNLCGRSSCSQWHDQTLYRSRKGRWYLEHRSCVQGESDWCEWISPEAAAAWLELNDREIPAELKEAAERSTE